MLFVNARLGFVNIGFFGVCGHELFVFWGPPVVFILVFQCCGMRFVFSYAEVVAHFLNNSNEMLSTEKKHPKRCTQHYSKMGVVAMYISDSGVLLRLTEFRTKQMHTHKPTPLTPPPPPPHGWCILVSL